VKQHFLQGNTMPYIKQADRDLLDPHILKIVEILKQKATWNVAGRLNYVITKIILSLWNNCRAYHMANSIVGALECASREFTRRELNFYEHEKIKENGDISPF